MSNSKRQPPSSKALRRDKEKHQDWTMRKLLSSLSSNASFAALSVIFIVTPPPFVWRGLRPTGRRNLPIFLPAKWRQIQEGPDASQCLDAPPVCKIGAKNFRPIAEKDTQAECFTFLGAHAEIFVEVASGPRRTTATSIPCA